MIDKAEEIARHGSTLLRALKEPESARHEDREANQAVLAEAALGLALIVIVDLNRIADALEAIAMNTMPVAQP